MARKRKAAAAKAACARLGISVNSNGGGAAKHRGGVISVSKWRSRARIGNGVHGGGVIISISHQ